MFSVVGSLPLLRVGSRDGVLQFRAWIAVDGHLTGVNMFSQGEIDRDPSRQVRRSSLGSGTGMLAIVARILGLVVQAF